MGKGNRQAVYVGCLLAGGALAALSASSSREWFKQVAERSIAGTSHRSALRAAGANANGVPDALSYSVDASWYFPGGAVLIADFTSDGRDDLVLVGAGADPVVVVLPQLPTGKLGAGVVYPTPLDASPAAVKLADVNEDGRLDLLLFQIWKPGFSTMLSAPGGGYVWREHDWIDKPITLDPQVFDANGDGHLDVVTHVTLSPYIYQHHDSRGHLVVHFGDGHGGFARDRLQLTGSEEVRHWTAGDFDGDGDKDLASFPENTGSAVWLRHGDGEGSFVRDGLLSALFMEKAEAATSGDLNGDGREDLMLAHFFQGEFWTFLQTPEGTLPSEPMRYYSNWGGSPSDPHIVDINRDGRMDIIYALRNAPQFVYALQSPYGFEAAVNFNIVPDAPQGPPKGGFDVGDLNGDGVPDVAARIGDGIFLTYGKLTPYTGAATLPGAPTISAAVPEATTANSLPKYRMYALELGPPASNGGSPVTGYEVYSIPSGGVDMQAGQPTLTHFMTGLEANRTYTFVARAITAVGKGPASEPSPPLVLGTPIDPAAPPSLSIGPYQGVETDVGSNGVVIFRAQLDKPAPVGGVGFSFSTTDGTAHAGSDYVAKSSANLRIPEGEFGLDLLSVEIIPDLQPEPTETFFVEVSAVTGATLGTPIAQMSIHDNDGTERRLVIGEVRRPEGDGTQTVNVPIALSSPAPTDVVFDLWSSPAYYGPGAQFVPVDRKGIVMPAGQTLITVPVTVFGNTVYGGDRMFELWILNAQGGNIFNSHASAFVIQMEDDPPPSLSIADVTRAEGDFGTIPMRFDVRLSQPINHDVSVNAVVEPLTASAGSDYRSRYFAGLIIPAGETSVGFDIEAHADTQPEADEAFRIRLENANYATIARGSALGTLLNDDIADGLAVDDVQIVEGGDAKTAEVTVRLSLPQDHPVSFDIATGVGTAQPGVDYLVSSASMVIPAGQATTTFNVTVLGDSLVELTESIPVDLRDVVGATPVRQGRIRILDDDLPELSISGPTVVQEGDAGARTLDYVLRLSRPVSNPVHFDIDYFLGSANFISDYRSQSKFDAFFDAGRTTYHHYVTVYGDTADEDDETGGFQVKNVRGASLANGVVQFTIQDDDLPVAPKAAVEAARRKGSGKAR